ncbi:MAG TPA: DUF86 domain-containing protein [Ignavibacteria bacterium]|nr:DUF86 domain-containing protein [Ignavibacteria bacterium]
MYKLEFVLECIDIILERFSSINEPDDFMTSPIGVTKLDSIAMRLQTIGESIKKIEKYNPRIFDKRKEVNWNDVIRMRDLISHHYYVINPAIIFDICKTHLPQLRSTIEKIITDLNKK